MGRNLDERTVHDFGEEWRRFDQRQLTAQERRRQFDQYFSIFPWEQIGHDAEGVDIGCGTGRWALEVAPRVRKLHLVDASAVALSVARDNLAGVSNCDFHAASVEALPVPDESMDFGYCLGVLHHVPDTFGGLRSAARKLKPGAPLLVYLYYALDGRPAWFRALWRVTDALRDVTSRLPHRAKAALAGLIAMFIYLPLARAAALLERRGVAVDGIPLSIYRDRSFYSMQTDAFDRFGTRLEKRFTREQIQTMLEHAGFEHIKFSPVAPYWCVVGYRRTDAQSFGADKRRP